MRSQRSVLDEPPVASAWQVQVLEFDRWEVVPLEGQSILWVEDEARDLYRRMLFQMYDAENSGWRPLPFTSVRLVRIHLPPPTVECQADSKD